MTVTVKHKYKWRKWAARWWFYSPDKEDHKDSTYELFWLFLLPTWGNHHELYQVPRVQWFDWFGVRFPLFSLITADSLKPAVLLKPAHMFSLPHRFSSFAIELLNAKMLPFFWWSLRALRWPAPLDTDLIAADWICCLGYSPPLQLPLSPCLMEPF